MQSDVPHIWVSVIFARRSENIIIFCSRFALRMLPNINSRFSFDDTAITM